MVAVAVCLPAFVANDAMRVEQIYKLICTQFAKEKEE